MSATTDPDRARLLIEQIQAAQLEADDNLFVAITRLAQRALTNDDAEVVKLLITARKALRRARGRVELLHPNQVATNRQES